MDELDKKIVRCLSENARMTVKDIARRVCLTSPAVSERIRRLEKAGTIAGYTVLLGRQGGPGAIEALISVSVEPKDRRCLSCHGAAPAARGAVLSRHRQPQLSCEGEL